MHAEHKTNQFLFFLHVKIEFSKSSYLHKLIYFDQIATSKKIIIYWIYDIISNWILNFEICRIKHDFNWYSSPDSGCVVQGLDSWLLKEVEVTLRNPVYRAHNKSNCWKQEWKLKSENRKKKIDWNSCQFTYLQWKQWKQLWGPLFRTILHCSHDGTFLRNNFP